MTYRYELDFRRPETGSPIARIYVKAGGYTEDGHPLVTPAKNVSMAELNSAIDRNIEKLEELRERARRKFEA